MTNDTPDKYEVTFGIESWEDLVATKHGDVVMRAILDAIKGAGKSTYMLHVKRMPR